MQSNSFERVYLVDMLNTEESNVRRVDERGELEHWKQTAESVSEEEMNYYSLQNAPLVDVQRLSSIDAFLAEREREYSQRDMVAVEIHPAALSLHSREAMQSLASPNAVVVIGAEDCGVPDVILDACTSIVEIPSMSASINVSCAFMAVLTVMNLAQVEGIVEQDVSTEA